MAINDQRVVPADAPQVFVPRAILDMQVTTIEDARDALEPLERDLGVELRVRSMYDPELTRDPVLLRWFTVDTPAGFTTREFAALIQSQRSRLRVREAEADVPADDAAVDVGEAVAPVRGHLGEWPHGVGLEPGQQHVGEGVGFADIEGGWTFDHDALQRDPATTLLDGQVGPRHRPHGTAAVAVVTGGAGGPAGPGIAPGVEPVFCVSHGGSVANIAPAIATATDELGCGDVLMIQAQTGPSCDAPVGAPVELIDAVREQVRFAIAAGVVVVAAAGNGGHDLGTLRTAQGTPAFPDDGHGSGALLVGAATSTYPHRRMPWSCHGSRVDCYAWGQDVATAWSTDWGATDRYTGVFGGTSAATAIVAGLAAVVQSASLVERGAPLTPASMRDLLTTSGADDPEGPDGIGVMPNYARALELLATENYAHCG